MRKIFTLSLTLLFAAGLFAQKPEGVIKKIEGDMVAPVIDGEVDDVWSQANVYNIDKNFQSELPTLPTLNPQTETVWKALYDEDGMYILLIVHDDVYYPSWVAGGDSWMFDKPEIYFDVNYVLQDGGGCVGGYNAGHYQFAPEMTEANHLGGEQSLTDGSNVKYAFKVDDPNYVTEYYVPFAFLNDKDGAPIDLTAEIGFDVTIIDRDPGDASRKRSVWSNVGAINEAWANMDDAGIITFEGAEPPIYVESIELSVDGNITQDNQTLQINALVLPEDATVKTLKWFVEPEGTTGRVSISTDGVITPILDGDVVIYATSMDGFVFSNEITVSISGQKVTLPEVSIVKNGYMDMVEESGMPTYWGTWVDGAVPEVGDAYGTPPTVVDGVAVLNSTGSHSSENWHYQFNQANLTGLPDIPYVVSFVAWSDNDRPICFDFEDTSGNNYNRYGASSDPDANGGRSEWTFPVTTTPTRYTFHVTFDQMVETTVQKIQFMISQATGTVYLDSVTVVSEADLEKVNSTSVQQLGIEQFELYPNPVEKNLHIKLSTPNTKVVIYNSVGVVMEEVEVAGTHRKFDVSRYAQGLYFVKAKNTVKKFIKNKNN